MAEDHAPAQRRWRAACPNCGAPVEFASAASASAVCGFCRSTLLREGEALRKTGESAELFADYSPLQIGTQGTYQNAPFTILGRVQLAYADGRWSEWHAFFDNSGKSAWLSEDNGQFVWSWPQALETPPPWAALTLGATATVGGQRFVVAALTQATVHAAEGELPEAPRLGQDVKIAELRSTRNEVGSLEYAEGAAPRWSVGQPVELGSLKLSHLREESSASWKGRSLQCPSCGAPVQPALSQSRSITCGQCAAVIELSEQDQGDLHFHAQAMGAEPAIALGRTGRLALEKEGAKLPWQVVGFLERCSTPDDEGEQYFWREYLLFNQKQGFAFLVDAVDGWSVVRVLTGAPEVDGARAQWQGQSFALQERYGAVTTHVLGEFYWAVRKDERGDVADYTHRDGRVLSREQSGQEVTWSLGRRLDAKEVAAAFALKPEQAALLKNDVAPGNTGEALKGLVVFAFVALLLIVLFRACSSDECEDFKSRFGETSAEYQQCRANQRSGSGYRSGSGSGGWSGGGFGGGHK